MLNFEAHLRMLSHYHDIALIQTINTSEVALPWVEAHHQTHGEHFSEALQENLIRMKIHTPP